MLTFFHLPWFIRYRILEYSILLTIQDLKSPVILSLQESCEGRQYLKGTAQVQQFHNLRLVSRETAREARVALFRTCALALTNRQQLEALPSKLDSTETGAVRSLAINVEHVFGNDAMDRKDRQFDCLGLSVAGMREICVNLERLELMVEPGCDKFHHQAPFQLLIWKNQIGEPVPPFGNAWGDVAAACELVTRSLHVMGPHLWTWVENILRDAKAVGIEVVTAVHFRSAADPRLSLEELVGRMSSRNWNLVVAHEVKDYVVPQVGFNAKEVIQEA